MSFKRYLSTLIFQKASEILDPPELQEESSMPPACLQSLDQLLEGIELDYKLRCDAIKKIRHPTIRNRACVTLAGSVEDYMAAIVPSFLEVGQSLNERDVLNMVDFLSMSRRVLEGIPKRIDKYVPGGKESYEEFEGAMEYCAKLEDLVVATRVGGLIVQMQKDGQLQELEQRLLPQGLNNKIARFRQIAGDLEYDDMPRN